MSEANGAGKPNGKSHEEVAQYSAARGDAEIPQVEPHEPHVLKKARGRGQPTKCTYPIVKRITDSMKLGNYFETACTVAGISPPVGRQWLLQGKRDRDKMIKSAFARFHEEVEKAHGLGEEGLVNALRVMAQKDHKAAAFMLSRKFPKRWGKQVELIVTAPNATPGSPYAGRSDDDLRFYIANGHWPEEHP